MEKISNNVSYKEVVHSATASRLGIENVPNDKQLSNIKVLAEKVFQPLREHFEVPIFISSGFRSAELNKALGGANSSQHMANNGAAFDLDADRYGKITNKQIFTYILTELEFDQLIAEMEENGQPRWIHCSYNEGKNRKEVLIAYKDDSGRTRYIPYSKEKYEEIYGK